MRTAIDSNVFSSIWSREVTSPNLLEKLDKARSEGTLLISPVVFAELHAYPGATGSFLQEFLRRTGVLVDYHLDLMVWSETAERFAAYSVRRRVVKGDSPRRLLTDFIVGAHALIQADRLLTLDTGLYKRNFPELQLL